MMKFKKSALILGVSLSALIALPAFAQEQTSSEGTVTVLGSRIKRINKEGPAPVTVIDAAAIKAGGYASVPDVLKSVTQNSSQKNHQLQQLTTTLITAKILFASSHRYKTRPAWQK